MVNCDYMPGSPRKHTVRVPRTRPKLRETEEVLKTSPGITKGQFEGLLNRLIAPASKPHLEEQVPLIAGCSDSCIH
jgi:hypothetical protein